MKDHEPTIRSRELGKALREAMNSAGYHASEMARRLGWSPSRVSRLLSGKRGGSYQDVMVFLAVCGVRGEERARLLKLAQDQDRESWFQQHGGVLPLQLRTLIDHESNATRYEDFQPMLVPGLLQTGDYARALLTGAGRVPPEEIDQRVSARLGRQNIFSKRGARFTFYIQEFVLRFPVGGRTVMSDQLHHLLRMAVRPNVAIRVIPTAFGVHAATAGPFILMDFDKIKPVVYVESETSSIFLERPIEIMSYNSILESLDGVALPEGQSREFIASVAVELYSDGEDQDALADE